jgi:hypothetical protein
VGLSILGLVGCGGGGGGGEPPPAAQRFAAEGFWGGRLNNGLDLAGVVLENGQYWFVYASQGVIYGFLQGTATASNGNFSSTDGLEFDFVNGRLTAFNVSGSYRERVSLQGTATPATGGSPSIFALTYDASYDTPATAAAVSGRWRGWADSTATYTIDVAANGAFTGTTSAGCTFGGSIVPRPSGKAVYDLVATFNGGACTLGTQTVRGVAVVQGSGASQVFIAAALNSARNAGFAVTGGR